MLSGEYKLKGDNTTHTLEWPKSGTLTTPNDIRMWNGATGILFIVGGNAKW